MRSRHEAPPGLLSWICDLGCDTLLLALPARLGSGDIEMPPLVDAAVAAGLQVQIDLVLHVATDRAAVLQEHPEWFREPARRFADPRLLKTPPGLHILDPAAAGDEAFIGYWTGVLGRWRDHGISGCRCKALGRIPPAVWRLLVEASPELHFSAWAPGEAAEDIGRLPRGCFGAVYNSLAWWDFDAEWLSQELARLRPVAPIANTVGLQDGSAPGRVMLRAAARLLDVAAANGHGFLLPMGFEFGIPSDLTHPEFGTDDWQRLQEHGRVEVAAALRQAGRRLAARVVPDAAPEILSGPGSAVAVLFEPPAQLTVANRSLERPARFDPSSVLPMLDGRQAGFADAAGTRLGRSPVLLAPGETRVFSGSPSRPVVTAAASRRSKRKQDFGAAGLAAATAASRVVIEAVTPTVDNGRFAAKRAVGERVVVEADVFVDGHGKVAAVLQWRAGDETGWRETPMQPLGNDRWSASFLPERVGCHWFRIQAWPDRFATYRDELGKKHAAGLDVTLELEEGRLLIEAMAESAPGTLDTLLAGLQGNGEERYPLLMGEEAAALTARADQRPGQVTSGEMPVEADRRAAQFASWYELFPRSQSGEASRHGTFRDVMRRLPAIRDMGFDVLYFPPIHPIGRINRKGRNNTLTPTQDDPGSPYAIGAAEGGHDAIHPELGTLDDFRALRDAAAAHGLELALDFAIQCSPDHPWLREHPEWFDWRPDGGLRYAENPPKKYEDIVNVDFHQAGAIPSLWLALRDVVAFWVREGVRIFRVDNPHTKPFPFWEWLIADIRASHPDTLFLSEAFTRPKVMQRLAKLGFTQSYTYFTWRNEKHEIETYLRELTAAAPAGANQADFFRPNFFVNTPDINPTFLQRSGRPGFLIRAALATTLSGLWGMLQGFEFCEAEPIPGKEEYANSDKYEIRSRPDRMPGDIVGEITRLNAIRRANPALQSHLGLAFHNAASDRVLWYRKANVDRSNVVLVAVSLDPFEPQTAVVEVPLWEWGLGDHAAIMVDDLMNGSTTTWHGKHRTISLDPRRLPFGIWRARPQETA